MSGRSAEQKRQLGFGYLELTITLLTFSIVMLAIMWLAVQMRKQSSVTNHDFIEAQRTTILALVMDGRSRARTIGMNPAPPTVVPPVPFAPFPPGTGALLDLYDSTASAAPVIRSTSPSAGFTLQGQNCASFSSQSSSPGCPLRFELRWFIVTTGSNPIVAVTVTLQVSPGALNLNPLLYSYDYQVLAPIKAMNPITRHLSSSWVAQGLVTSRRLAYVNFSNVPDCGAAFIPGSSCSALDAVCICPTTVCPVGQELYRCQ